MPGYNPTYDESLNADPSAINMSDPMASSAFRLRSRVTPGTDPAYDAAVQAERDKSEMRKKILAQQLAGPQDGQRATDLTDYSRAGKINYTGNDPHFDSLRGTKDFNQMQDNQLSLEGPRAMTGRNETTGESFTMTPQRRMRQTTAMDVMNRMAVDRENERKDALARYTLDAPSRAATEANKHADDVSKVGHERDMEMWRLNHPQPQIDNAALVDAAKTKGVVAASDFAASHGGRSQQEVDAQQSAIRAPLVKALMERAASGDKAAMAALPAVLSGQPGYNDPSVSGALGVLSTPQPGAAMTKVSKLMQEDPEIQGAVADLDKHLASHSVRYTDQNAQDTQGQIERIVQAAKLRGLNEDELAALQSTLQAKEKGALSKNHPYNSTASAGLNWGANFATGGLSGLAGPFPGTTR